MLILIFQELRNLIIKFILIAGSIGKPKIGGPNITYSIIEINKEDVMKIQIKEIPYDFKRIVKAMTVLGFPE